MTCRMCGGQTIVERTQKAARCDTRERRCLKCGDKWETSEREVAMTRQRAGTVMEPPPECQGTATNSAPPAVPASSAQSSSLDLSDISPDLTSNQTHARKSDLGAKVFTFPTVGKGGQWWSIRETQHTELIAAFPHLDIGQQYAKALVWLNANPAKRKTPRGMYAFLFRWMERTQNSGSNKNGSSRQAISFAVAAEESRSERHLDALAEALFDE